MSNILFAWELGAGFGHLLPYREVLRRLCGLGHKVYFAAADVERARDVYKDLHVTVLQAVRTTHVETEITVECKNFGELLQHHGFGDRQALEKSLAEWRAIFAQIKPDVVVADHAPLALLALRSWPAARIHVGTGFTCPPDIQPFPVLRYWEKANQAELLALENRLLSTVNDVLRASGQSPLQRLGQLFAEVDAEVLSTLPELDHYRQRKGGRYWGTFTLYSGVEPVWPDKPGKKIFAYLKNVEKLPEFMRVLHESGMPTLLILDSVPPERIAGFSSETVRIEKNLLNLSQVSRSADIVVLNGGHNTLVHFACAGKPMLLFPILLEQFTACKALEDMGMALIADRDNPAEFTPKLAQVLNSETMVMKARQFAERYAQIRPEIQVEHFAALIDRLARTPLNPRRFERQQRSTPQMSDIQQALKLHKSGKLQEAAKMYQAVLEQDPLNVDALHLLGVSLIQRGAPEKAAGLIGRAIALRPNEPAFYNNQGEAFRFMGRFDQAAACYKQALRLNPRYADALNNLGLVLQNAGQHQEATRCFEGVLKLQPNSAMAHNNLGIALIHKGDRAGAAQEFRRAIEINPEYGEAHCNLGQVLLELNQSKEALTHCRRAVELCPNLPAAHNNLGNVLREEGQLKEAKNEYAQALQLNPNIALTCNNIGQALQEEGALGQAKSWYERALQLDPRSARVHTNYASLLSEDEQDEEAQRELELALQLDPSYAEAHTALAMLLKEKMQVPAAIEHYRRALQINPHMASAHCGMGDAYQEIGKLEEAQACFRESIRINPRLAGGYTMLATHLKGKIPDHEFKAMLELAEDPTLPRTRRAALLFGLAHTLDARGDYDKAGAYLAEANAIRKEEWEKRGKSYDPQDHAAHIDSIIATFTPEFFSRTQNFGVDSTRPLFVLGLPRSGTTLVEQVLASHSKIFGAGELRFTNQSLESIPSVLKLDKRPIDCMNDLTREAVQEVAGKHLEKLAAINASKPHIVDKMPDNYQHIGLILTLFPNAKIIHCRRELKDIAVSCWMTNFRQIRWACDQQHIAHRFQQYRRVMDHWRSVLGGRFLEVDYEQTVSNLEETAKKMISFIGLDWEESCLSFHKTDRPVRTASVTQVREPVHTRSVQRWKNYEKSLGTIFSAL